MLGRSIAALGIVWNALKLTILGPHGERIVKPWRIISAQLSFERVWICVNL